MLCFKRAKVKWWAGKRAVTGRLRVLPGLCRSFHGVCATRNPPPGLSYGLASAASTCSASPSLTGGSTSTKLSLQSFPVPLPARVVVQDWGPQELYCLLQHQCSRWRNGAQLSPPAVPTQMQVELLPRFWALIMQAKVVWNLRPQILRLVGTKITVWTTWWRKLLVPVEIFSIKRTWNGWFEAKPLLHVSLEWET